MTEQMELFMTRTDADREATRTGWMGFVIGVFTGWFSMFMFLLYVGTYWYD